MDCLSRRGHSNVTKTMAQLPKAMLKSVDDDTDVEGSHEPIDLSVAENWLIREEVLGIGKLAIEKHFDGHRRNIHLISEEVFALSTFQPSQVNLPETRHFVSMLAVDPTALDCDPGRVHVVWSMSKDFAAGGIKLVRAAASIIKTDIYNS
ncbi:MAG: hypothetical protein Q9161_007580 [Pseudevernia consocians]